jgi:hypothetical protein
MSRHLRGGIFRARCSEKQHTYSNHHHHEEPIFLQPHQISHLCSVLQTPTNTILLFVIYCTHNSTKPTHDASETFPRRKKAKLLVLLILRQKQSSSPLTLVSATHRTLDCLNAGSVLQLVRDRPELRDVSNSLDKTYTTVLLLATTVDGAPGLRHARHAQRTREGWAISETR